MLRELIVNILEDFEEEITGGFIAGKTVEDFFYDDPETIMGEYIVDSARRNNINIQDLFDEIKHGKR